MPDRNLKDTFASLQRGLLFKEDLGSHGFQKHIKYSPLIFLTFPPQCAFPTKALEDNGTFQW